MSHGVLLLRLRPCYLAAAIVGGSILFLYFVYWSNISIHPHPSVVLRPLPTVDKNIDVTPSDYLHYLVNTPQCQIPALNPFDPSVLHLIGKVPKVECSTRPPLTKLVGKTVVVDPAVLATYNASAVKCCFSGVTRNKEGQSDNGYKVSSKCTPFLGQTELKTPFVRVRCQLENASSFLVDDYVAFHGVALQNSTVEKRCSKFGRPLENNDHLNVILFGIDAVSRLSTERYLPKFRNYLTNFLGAVDMVGFNKVGDNTFPNVIPLLTGMSEEELRNSCWKDNKQLDDCPWLWKEAMQNGYRTLFGEDEPSIGMFNYLKKGFYKTPTDYYMRPLALAAVNDIGHSKYLNTRQCIGPRLQPEILLDWIADFALNFARRRYLAFSWTTSLTHDRYEGAGLLDLPLTRWIHKLHKKGALQRTALVILSDHGLRWGSFRQTSHGHFEERLPLLMVALPEAYCKRKPEHCEAVRTNAHRLTTHYDLFYTLRHLMGLPLNVSLPTNASAVRGMTLLNPITQNRTCESAGIEPHWCTCLALTSLNQTSPLINSTAQALVAHLNELSNDSRCERLSLGRVVSTFARQTTYHQPQDVFQELVIVVETQPGGGMFEATLRTSALYKGHRILGDISRLNLYGNQSYCVTELRLKKYCYCRQNITQRANG